ncbi:lipid IV(A) 3-deoxy-D-manno-octulosonic acid transferase [Neisseria animalis]|uniref:3-deoxy-D-manno-octulosonic acid transferase n=1 Tax=Neisseria animalis TaxID=492 RepID=A0A5P3MR50_NEIAN|nr:lipid IV(A) 3-deoxy-D-manno-octulosonic acid transferase [Neisseria animalis]QEY24077.1 3-deoxy-D-manno-octulosonic acid transferase [Neisseria animalis]ROW32645.1 3-deoxy-D-manno-octulosonic acid transferase [Neisseria animalis]VEE06222.1 3-deoxy-D-manno-octulosonic-acid transferase [Neisseria animalis]
MIRRFYNLLWCVAPLFIRRYLKKRARKSPAYLENWHERFGGFVANPVQQPVWIHAVSVGETRAAVPLAAALRQRFPDAPLLLTQMTPTGREAAEILFPDAQCRYLPYDKPEWVRQFLREHRPRFGILMETEIWPNLMHGCRDEGVPLFLANARLSEKSQRGYLKIRNLVEPAMRTLSGCFAQTAADAERLHLIGASNVHVCGNTKYDIAPPDNMRALAAAFRERIGSRPVVLCASTRFYKGADETAMLLEAWKAYRGDALLVVVPRHPERFQTAFDTARSLGYRVQKRSDDKMVAADTQVWIGDSMGELFAYYLSSNVAFVGGSLVDTGCQNIIEPIACGIPTLFGPSTYNFAAVCESAKESRAARQVADAEEWRQVAEACLENGRLREEWAAQAEAFVSAHRGASRRMADEVVKSLGRVV